MVRKFWGVFFLLLILVTIGWWVYAYRDRDRHQDPEVYTSALDTGIPRPA